MSIHSPKTGFEIYPPRQDGRSWLLVLAGVVVVAIAVMCGL